jgi:hypothetical protein
MRTVSPLAMFVVMSSFSTIATQRLPFILVGGFAPWFVFASDCYHGFSCFFYAFGICIFYFFFIIFILLIVESR